MVDFSVLGNMLYLRSLCAFTLPIVPFLFNIIWGSLFRYAASNSQFAVVFLALLKLIKICRMFFPCSFYITRILPGHLNQSFSTCTNWWFPDAIWWHYYGEFTDDSPILPFFAWHVFSLFLYLFRLNYAPIRVLQISKTTDEIWVTNSLKHV